jgi:hypothetical protein
MDKKILLAAAFLFLSASLVEAQMLTPAVNAKKGPSQNRVALCKKEAVATNVPKNGYTDFMKNCLRRKVMPAQ